MTDDAMAYELLEIKQADVQNVELSKDFGLLREDEAIEAYRVRLMGERGMNAGGQLAEMVYLPERGRAGIEWAGEVIWLDASSAEEAMERYLDHNFPEDDDPGM